MKAKRPSIVAADYPWRVTQDEHDDGAQEDGLDPLIDWDAHDQRAIKAGKQMLAQVVGAGVGFYTAGPLGALSGAAIGAGVVPLLELMAEGQHRAIKRVQRLADEVTDLADLSIEEFTEWARATEQREALTLAATHAALNAVTQEKLTALARILAENVSDDRDIYVSSLIVKALTDMEEPHILALRALVLEDLPRDPEWNLGPGPEGYAQAQLERRFPHFAEGVPQILATLEAHGIVRTGLAITQDNMAGQVTAFGKRCLEYLRDYPLPPTVAGEQV
jgi:hypothetical protein